MFAADANKKRLAFFKIKYELVSLVLRLFKSWEKIMDLERFITVFIFVSRAVCRCNGKKSHICKE